MHGPAIRFSGIGLDLSGTSILHDIDLTVDAGSIHCLIGPNGSGKTSLIRCLLGQMPHTGQIEVDWQDSTTTGYVPQFLDFDKTLPITVADFMTMVCEPLRPAFVRMRKRTRQLTAGVLGRVGLDETKLRSKVGSLSGGERQRVLFAQALIPTPALLILDEPMTSMDEVGIDRFLKLIRELADGGTTIVWIAHELAQVRTMADKVSCIAGTVLFSGAPADVLDGQSADALFTAAAST